MLVAFWLFATGYSSVRRGNYMVFTEYRFLELQVTRHQARAQLGGRVQQRATHGNSRPASHTEAAEQRLAEPLRSLA